MKAIAVTPGKSSSARLLEVPDPTPAPTQILVRVLQVGLCGTDAEINQGLYGEAPPGSDYLIIGHESLGRVEAVGAEAKGFAVGELVAAMVRRPDDCLNCRHGEPDMCLKGDFKERGIKGLHGFMAEYYVEEPTYLVKVPPSLLDIGVLAEPLSIAEKAVRQALAIQQRMVWEPRTALVLGVGPIGLLATAILRHMGLDTFALATNRQGNFKAQLVENIGATYLSTAEDPIITLAEKLGNLDLIIEATGSSTVAFQAMTILGTNGVLCLTGVSGGDKKLEVASDSLNLGLVLGNKTVFGTVNANRKDWDQGIAHLGDFQRKWPGLIERMITRRLPLEHFAEGLSRRAGDVKTVLEPTPSR